ncbi:MAG: M1 family metallopeptidase [Chloroflexota bacterium]
MSLGNYLWARHVKTISSMALVPLLLGTLLLLGLSHCASPAEPDPYARYRPAMKADFQNDLDLLGPVPEYSIAVTLSQSLEELKGRAQIIVPNTSPHIWDDHLLFRLYPSLPQYGGKMTIQIANVNGKPARFDYKPRTEKSAIRLVLEEPLFPGEEATVELIWHLQIPIWQDISSGYHLFGNSQQMTSLPLFYPALSVYEPEKSFGQGEWWSEVGSVRGDAAFSPISLFVVTATIPSYQVPVASGTLVTSTFVSDSEARHVWVTGPSREFLLHNSAQFSYAYAEAYGTRVTSFWLPGDEAAGRAALQYAIGALRIFSDKFGMYPYRDMRVAPAPLAFRGMEYPQVSLLGVEDYNRFRSSLESLTAHEVAHQWWYQIVHNDPVNMPWLDESLAEYSIKIYVENIYGEQSADALQARRWQNRVNGLSNKSLLIDQPVLAFDSGPVYEAIIYSKGALFYDQLRSRLGERAFFKFFQSYFERHRYRIVETEDWLADIEALEDEELLRLVEEWIASTNTAESVP